MDMGRRQFLSTTGGLLALAMVAACRDTKPTARIGWLGIRSDGGSVDRSIPLEGLREGLKDRGWIEGQNLAIEQRSGNFDNAHDLAVELVQAKVALIVAEGGMIFRILAASEVTPLLFHINGDPEEAKLVTSYARPGGNRTGVTNLSDVLSRKRVELLREALPHMTRVAAIANVGHPGWKVEEDATQAAARQLGLDLTWLPVTKAADISPALGTAARERVAGIVAVPDNLITGQATTFATFTAKHGIPAISGSAAFAEAGNLMTYGPNQRDVYVKLGTYADRILKGAKPADLPVENPSKFELVINRATFNAMKLAVPPSLLALGPRVV
jgi:putative ABC transport system substrate-binding protein